MQRETELVVALCRAPLRDNERQRAAHVMDQTIDWPLFFAKAAAWGVEPLVLFNLNANFAASLSPDVRRRSATLEKNARGAALANTLVLLDVVERLRDKGIDPLVLKGPALGVDAYGDPSLRGFSDIDLLVKPNDVAAASEVLLRVGYTRDFDAGAQARLLEAEHALEFSGQRMKVELHTVLLSRHLRFRIDEDRLWQSVRDIDWGERTLRTIGAPEHFLFLCAHGAKHEWERLGWVSDLAHLGRRLSGAERRTVAALAKAAHGERLLALGVRLARDVFNELDTPFDDLLTEPESTTNPLIAAAKRRIGLESGATKGDLLAQRLHPNLRALVYWSRARERQIDRVASLARVILVPSGRGGESALAFLGRPFSLIARAARNVISFRGREPGH